MLLSMLLVYPYGQTTRMHSHRDMLIPVTSKDDCYPH